MHFLCYKPSVYSALDRFTIALCIELKKKGYTSIIIFNDEICLKELRIDILKAEAKIELLNTRQSKIKIIKDLRNLLKKYKPEIVHSHFEFYIKTILALFCYIYRIRFYFSNHSLKFSMTAEDYRKQNNILKVYRWKFYLKLLLFLCERSFCVSEAVRKEFSDFAGTKTKKLQLQYLGVRINSEVQAKETQRRKLNLSLNKVLVVNISAIDFVKGIDILIKAARILREKHKQKSIQIIHIGGLRLDNDSALRYENELKNLQEKLVDYNEYFIWLGKRNDVYNILSACDIYVHPARMEGLPTTIMEAFSARLPAVGTRVGGIPEIIEDGVCGILVDPENEIQLADALNYLISNEPLRRKMGYQAFVAVKDKWNMEVQVAKLIEAYGIY